MAAQIPAHLAANPFLDFSGVDTAAFENPYDALLHATGSDPEKLQDRYSVHRATRNAQQKEKLLAPDFDGVILDPVLVKLEDGHSVQGGYEDPRHCLVFWGRPEDHIRDLIVEVQRRLKDVAPNLWLMPRECLHITILEITHSKTVAEIEVLKKQIGEDDVAQNVVDYTNVVKTKGKRARLVRPMIGFDASALALGFVPAAGPGDDFSYHHLRRDTYDLVSKAGVVVDSRYVVPSAHLTIARFVTAEDFEGEDGKVDQKKMKKWISTIKEVNEWLAEEYWENEGNGAWTVGDGDGLVLRWGTVWYGGGKTMAQTSRQ